MNATLFEKNPENNEVTSYKFKPEAPLNWQAGQFIEYALPHPNSDDRGESRYFTISSAPYQEYIQITTRISGQNGSSFKTALDQLSIGEQIQISEPMGEFIIDELANKYVLVAGGIGITPFWSMLQEFAHQGKMPNITLLYANRDHQIAFKDKLDEMATAFEQLSIQYFIDPVRIELEDIQAAVSQLGEQAKIYISGPKPMVGHYRKALRESGIDKSDIKTDYFPGYDN